MTEIGFDSKTQGVVAGHMESADVRGPGGPNAFPSMVRRKFVGETAVKIVRLSDIYRIPVAVMGKLGEDVDARTNKVDGADGVVLKFIPRE